MQPVPIGDALKSLLRRTKPKRRRKSVDAADAAWRAAAGPALAARSELRGVASGAASVAVDSAPLFHELSSFRRGELLARLNEELLKLGAPAVSELRFRLGTLHPNAD